MHPQIIIDDEILIPQLTQNILGEDMFFRVADDMAMLGAYDEYEANYHLPYLNGEQELALGVLRLLEELQVHWMSPTVGRAIRFLFSPHAMALLLEMADQKAARLTCEHVRLCQAFVSDTLERLLTEAKEDRFDRIKISDRFDLIFYFKSDLVINDVLHLDMQTTGLKASLPDDEFATFILLWCLEKMRQVWHDQAVSASVDWICRNHAQIVRAIVSSKSFSDGTTCNPPEQARFVCMFTATVIERFATEWAEPLTASDPRAFRGWVGP
jgi:hypothetical protein